MNSFHLIAALAEEKCACGGQAVNYLRQGIGYQENEVVEKQVCEITIPLCQDCLDWFQTGKWVLFVCLNCADIVWHCKELSRRNWATDVRLAYYSQCPGCSQEPKWIWVR